MSAVGAFWAKSLILSSLLLAHGDAEWIEKSTKFSYCCGKNDCEKAPKGAVARVQGGYMIVETGQFFPYGNENLWPSKDDDFWWCRPSAPLVKCLFEPLGNA